MAVLCCEIVYLQSKLDSLKFILQLSNAHCAPRELTCLVCRLGFLWLWLFRRTVYSPLNAPCKQCLLRLYLCRRADSQAMRLSLCFTLATVRINQPELKYALLKSCDQTCCSEKLFFRDCIGGFIVSLEFQMLFKDWKIYWLYYSRWPTLFCHLCKPFLTQEWRLWICLVALHKLWIIVSWTCEETLCVDFGNQWMSRQDSIACPSLLRHPFFTAPPWQKPYQHWQVYYRHTDFGLEFCLKCKPVHHHFFIYKRNESVHYMGRWQLIYAKTLNINHSEFKLGVSPLTTTKTPQQDSFFCANALTHCPLN